MISVTQKLKCWLGYHTEMCRLVPYSKVVFSENDAVRYEPCGNREHFHCAFCGEFIRFGAIPADKRTPS